jgi:hypothetical protein
MPGHSNESDVWEFKQIMQRKKIGVATRRLMPVKE